MRPCPGAAVPIAAQEHPWRHGSRSNISVPVPRARTRDASVTAVKCMVRCAVFDTCVSHARLPTDSVDGLECAWLKNLSCIARWDGGSVVHPPIVAQPVG